MPKRSGRLMGGLPVKTKEPSLTVCQRLAPGLGLRMGMDRRRSPSPPPEPPQLFHVLVTGQSLAVGAAGTPVLTTTQPYSNLMFVGGVRAVDPDLGSVVPLIATVDADPEGGFDGETIANGAVDQLTNLSSPHRYLVSNHGHSGFRYIQLKKGTAPYQNGMDQAQAGFDLLGAESDYLGILAVATAHGEQDQAFNTVDYADKLAEWQVDYDADLKAITGQTRDIPLLVYQQCNLSPHEAASAATSTALESLRAHEENPGKVILVGANYSWVRQDGTHLTANGYRSMGLMYSRVLRALQAGETWEPIRPLDISRAGAVIDITFAVPRPPLVFDLERVFNPGNYGFTFKDDDDSAVVDSVEIVGDDLVRVTLDAVPTGANKLIRYGWRHSEWAGGGPKGPLSSARGNLRDQGDADANLYGYSAFNWGVLFNKSAE